MIMVLTASHSTSLGQACTACMSRTVASRSKARRFYSSSAQKFSKPKLASSMARVFPRTRIHILVFLITKDIKLLESLLLLIFHSGTGFGIICGYPNLNPTSKSTSIQCAYAFMTRQFGPKAYCTGHHRSLHTLSMILATLITRLITA